LRPSQKAKEKPRIDIKDINRGRTIILRAGFWITREKEQNASIQGSTIMIEIIINDILEKFFNFTANIYLTPY
jgi:hypothetical protein